MMTQTRITQKLLDHLRWYVKVDETQDGDPANAYFTKGRNNAEELIAAIERGDFRAALSIPTVDEMATIEECPHEVSDSMMRYLFEVDYFNDLQRRGLTKDFPGVATWACRDRFSDLDIEQHAQQPSWATHVYFSNEVAA